MARCMGGSVGPVRPFSKEISKCLSLKLLPKPVLLLRRQVILLVR